MRVLQLSKYYPPTHGGLEIVAEFFSRALRELGSEVTVVSLGVESISYLGRFGEKVHQCRENLKLRSSPLSIDYFLECRRIVHSESPDLILVHLPHPFAHELAKWLRPSLRGRGTKIVGVYHSDIINQRLLRDAYNLHFTRDLDAYDYFVCSSPDLKRSSAVLSGLPEKKVKIIPFCIDHPKHEMIRRSRPFEGRFVSVGRMVPYKGYEFLVKSFEKLPYRLTLIGNGPLKSKLQGLAGSNVEFVGSVGEEEKFRILSQHDALIMSSINRAEAYGMTIVEAFSIGLPVIASNVDTGVSYLVRHGETGLKFPICDGEGLRKQIERLREEPGLADRLSNESLRFFRQELAFDAFKRNVSGIL